MACGVSNWRGVGLCVRLGWPIWVRHGAWHNSPSFCMACCREVAWKHLCRPASLAANRHRGVLRTAFSWLFCAGVADLASRRFVSDGPTDRLCPACDSLCWPSVFCLAAGGLTIESVSQCRLHTPALT